MAHPFATAGGGTLFEYKVATLLAADLIRSRLTAHGGIVVAVEMQTGPPGFDDLQTGLELLGGGHRTMHAQCRYRQQFTASDAKFVTLLAQAEAAVKNDEEAFASGSRRLAVVVDRESPGHVSMAELCELARAPGDLARFVDVVEAHGNRVSGRWRHCLRALDGTEPEMLHRVLAALEVQPLELRTATSRDSLELVNRLADAWDPPNPAGAVDLSNALFRYLTEIGPRAGAIDLRSLKAELARYIPATLGATSRRSRLDRMLDAGLHRVTETLRATGLDAAEASELAARALATPPSVAPTSGLTVVTGAMGVGKTTELERLHRQALLQAMDDPNVPIPVFVHAREIGGESLQSVVEAHTTGLGDPTRVGAHVIVDGLDEAGLRIGDLASRAATVQGAWPASTVITATRPQPPEPHVRTEILEPLSWEAATELMTAIHSDVAGGLPSRAEVADVLRRPLFAIRYALDRRKGHVASVNEAQLVNSVGQHIVDELADMADEIFALLLRLACRVVDSGGQAIDLKELDATPIQIGQVMRSRVVHSIDGRASFQLAALTEWFAATALLRDQRTLQLSVSSPLRAHRWRYALVQALLQGSTAKVDTIMSTLLNQAPATAAWVYHRAQIPYRQQRTTPPAPTALDAGSRVKHAARAWIEPWPPLVDRRMVDGDLPALGVAMDGNHLVTAWRKTRHGTVDSVVPLPRDTSPFDRPSDWTRWSLGHPEDGELWPWQWTRRTVQQEIDALLQGRELLANLETCWAELAWHYAHQILGQNAQVKSEPVVRSALEAVVADVHAAHPSGTVHVNPHRSGGWRLDEAQLFLNDLARLGIHEIRSPWPPADTRGSWTWTYWTTEQLLKRLTLTTPGRARRIPRTRRPAPTNDGPPVAQLSTAPGARDRHTCAGRSTSGLGRPTSLRLAPRAAPGWILQRCPLGDR